LALNLLRLAVFAALALVLLREPLLRHVLLPMPHPAAGSSVSLLKLPTPAELAGAALHALLTPPILPLLRFVALAGLAAIAAELALAAMLLPLQRLVTRRRGACATYLLVRTPPASIGSSVTRPLPANDAALFHALSGALPAGGALTGHAPWCVFMLGAAPDQPVELGVLIAGELAQRERLTAAIRHALAGQRPDALIESTDDPLVALSKPIHWREFGLALPPHYPLRQAGIVPDEAPFAGLLAALRPRGGVARVELQVIVRGAGGVNGWALNRGWRARATALKLGLEQKQDYALAPDVAALESKLAAAPFTVTLRAVAVAEDDADARAALDAVEDALAAYQARVAGRLQRLVRIGEGGDGHAALVRAPRFAPPQPLLLPARPWRVSDVLAATELCGLWRLPSPPLATLVRGLSCRQLPAPPHAFVPPGAVENEPRLILGHARRSDGSYAPVGPTLRDLRQIMHVTAGMGAGKSRLLANLCAQLTPHGFLLIDGKGDDREGSLVATVRQLIPLADERRLVLLDVLDNEWPIGLNPLASVNRERPGGVDLALGQVLAIFARLDPETWGKAVGMQQFAQMATLLVLEGEQHPTLAHIKQALLDEAYRVRLLEHTRNVEVRTFWRVTFPQLGEGQKSSRDALLRRFDMLLAAETTRLLITQAEPTIDLLDAIEEGLIILTPIPDMTLGGLAGAVAMVMFQAFVRAAFAREGTDRSRASFTLIVDELQVLAGGGESADLETALTRLRSLGIPSIYAHQALAQLGELAGLMQINAANRVILRTGEPDATVYARAYAASGLTAADISEQDPLEHQYAVIRSSGLPAGPLSMRPLPWPAPVPANPPVDHERDWQTVLPIPADPLDPLLLRAVYGACDERIVATLAALGDADWQRVLARWDAIRRCQRQFILDHPGCIADRLERQTWLSRLFAARPRVLAAAEYERARPTV
jgi:hypothetical protein